MPSSLERIADFARVTLSGIRLVNGIAALLAPEFLISRLGVDPDTHQAMIYPFRMFGIRTIVIGAELLLAPGPIRAHAQNVAILIHASDAITAMIAHNEGQLPPRQATITVAISATNTLLSLLLRLGKSA